MVEYILLWLEMEIDQLKSVEGKVYIKIMIQLLC